MEKSKEIQHVTNALKANGYPSSIISNILKNKKKRPTQTIPTPEELVGMFLSGPIHQTQVLISLAFLISMASLNRSQDYFVIMEFESSLNLTEHYNKNFLHQNSGHPLISKPTLFTRSHIPIALGITSVKRVDVC